MSTILINATFACCSCALVTFLYKHFYHERNEVVFFYGQQQLCDSHHSINTINRFSNSDCSVCKVNKIVEWLNETKKTLDVCMYMINSDIFTNALINAQKRGVTVRLIVNEDNDRALWKLGENGIAKRSKQPNKVDCLMHHKFIIIDNKKIILGSLNWTVAGIRQNYENTFLTNQQEFIEPFREEFQRLWNNFSYKLF